MKQRRIGPEQFMDAMRWIADKKSISVVQVQFEGRLLLHPSEPSVVSRGERGEQENARGEGRTGGERGEGEGRREGEWGSGGRDGGRSR